MFLFLFTVLFYPREWEHLGNSHCLCFFLWASNLRVEENLSRNYYGISGYHFEIEEIQLSPFRIFRWIFRHFQNKYKLFGYYKSLFEIHDIPASIAKRRIIKYVRKLVALWLFWFSTAWFSWFLFSWTWVWSSVAFNLCWFWGDSKSLG